MQSGNGRHRRPRPVNRVVLKAGVAGAGVALPLLGVTTAHAADSTTWQKVADCESGGDWTLNSSNGFYGGLQFTQSTWEAFGGTQYAERPDLATESQQIAVAEKVLAEQGPEAWPVCGATAGLSDDGSGGDGSSASPSPSSSPSSSASPSPSSSSSSSGGDQGKRHHGHSGGSGSDDSFPSPSATPSQTGTPTPTPSATSPSTPPSTSPGQGGGRHAGPSGDGGSTGSDDGGQGGGKHAKGGAEYTVRPGDNLWDIAHSHGVDGGWKNLYRANKSTVGDNPSLILPGQHLALDGADGSDGSDS
ncbi:hypothetical protein BIV57_03695 [Mangrovactinospora gilvigrisea]|uniref:LysM domain-containing protein n=1 Tax=Mangrovactinospora gilvigrisea TaxID=1428644 RepID=A0A1J7BJX6_9ACTN|nr:hypothetical protein BIV57_03695 [Mangrovactinospora gilvigrisea]